MQECPLNEEMAEISSEDPLMLNVLEFKLHSSIHNRWKFWFNKDNGKDQKGSVQEKYKNLSGLEVYN